MNRSDFSARNLSRPARCRGLPLTEIEMGDGRQLPQRLWMPGGVFDLELAAEWMLRAVIGGALAWSAVAKMADVAGFAKVMLSYQNLPDWSVTPCAVALVFFQLRLAEAVLRGSRLVLTSLASTFLHGLFFIWAGAALWRGIRVSNSGIFGVFLARPLCWRTVIAALALMGCSWALFHLAWRRSRWQR